MDSAWLDTLTGVGAVLPDTLPVAAPTGSGPIGSAVLVLLVLWVVAGLMLMLVGAPRWWHDGVRR